MLIARTLSELQDGIADLRRRAARVGLVPTMGALHSGHVSLVAASQDECDATVVSIFVNPTQFGPGEDLSRYPRPLERDLELLREAAVDLVFVPEPDIVYPAGCTTRVEPPAVARSLEGESRPTHFRGVATVVLKLLLMTGADRAFFGQKDYQQTLVIRHMVRDLNVPVDIVTCPIIRDADGLALSSRNAYLSDAERQAATSLSRTLRTCQQSIDEGETDARMLMAEMTQSLIEGGVTYLEYAVIADADTLAILDDVRRPLVILIAARVGETRLIDNMVML